MNKTTVIIAIILAVAIPLCNAIVTSLGLVSVSPLWVNWPGFFVVLLFLIGKEKTLRDCMNIVVSGIVGIIWSYLGAQLIGACMGFFDPILAVALGVGAMVFLFALLMGPLPLFFNNYGFLFYLVAALFTVQEPVLWSCSTVIVGAVYMLLVFGGIKLFCGFDSIQLTMKPGEQPEKAE